LTNPNFAYWVLQINCLLSEKRGVIKRNFQYTLFGLSRVVCVNHVRSLWVVTSGLREPRALALRWKPCFCSCINAALVASQWQNCAWSFTPTHRARGWTDCKYRVNLRTQPTSITDSCSTHSTT